MSDIIHLLPDTIANQIAAGEVIQRPASVVKELVENAIDAGATSIVVEIKDAGRTLIRVVDNGKGMSETDARMAFERHATSKISKADDLFSLKTMGFRGEALASIAAVAQVELLTRLHGSDVGTKLCIEGSSIVSIEPEVCLEGSIFSVKNLFYNVPARRKFLKSNDTEFRNIMMEFERVALVNPSVSMSLLHNDVPIFDLHESGLRQRVQDVFGKNVNSKLLTVNTDSSLVTINGFVGRPDSAKKRGFLQYFFVNGRFMKHSYFHKAVLSAYEELIPRGEQPNYFIHFELDPSTIDVNIHPTKTEIKFENEQEIWKILMSAIREALAKSSSIPLIDFDTEDKLDFPVYNELENQHRETTIGAFDGHSKGYNPFENTDTTKFQNPDFDWNKLYAAFESDKEAALDDAVESFLDETMMSDAHFQTDTQFEKQSLKEIPSTLSFFEKNAAPCFQYKERYILTTLDGCLALINQHRAHVRVLYDRFMSSMELKQMPSQKMLFPEIVEFTVAESLHYEAMADELILAGFDISNLGNNSYAINGIPGGLENVDGVALLKDIVVASMEQERKADKDVCAMIALPMAKAAAIKAGKILSSEEMEHLVISLKESKERNLTPEGKIIYTLFTDEEIEKRLN